MPWFYVDDAFADSKPVMRLPERLRNEAVGLWVRCGAWSAKEETDGHVPIDVVRQFGGTSRTVVALANDAQLWEPLEAPENWRKSREIIYRNWEKWQKTRAENERKRKQDAARQQEHRRAKKGRDYVPSERVTSADAELSQRDTQRDNPPLVLPASKDVSRRESQRPDPDPTLSSNERVCSPVGQANGSPHTHAERPSEFCHNHPHGTRIKCGDCANARRTAVAWDRARQDEADIAALARVNERQRELDRLHDCTQCDSAGWIYDDDPQAPARKCNHQTLTGATA